jgi:hypothetical protein
MFASTAKVIASNKRLSSKDFPGTSILSDLSVTKKARVLISGRNLFYLLYASKAGA